MNIHDTADVNLHQKSLSSHVEWIKVERGRWEEEGKEANASEWWRKRKRDIDDINRLHWTVIRYIFSVIIGGLGSSERGKAPHR